MVLRRVKDILSTGNQTCNPIEERMPSLFRQHQRYMNNPKVAPVIQRKLWKLLEAHIITPIIYSNWVANVVTARNKNGKIRICIDLRNLNLASLKDNYTLPSMDRVLQMVTGPGIMSMLYGFFGYNQVLVAKVRPAPKLAASTGSYLKEDLKT